jgi:8-oxo-dGTP diphosphatase
MSKNNTQKTIGVSQKVIIFNREGKILALRRSKTHPFHSFYWDFPGGVMEFGEDAGKSILRETKEETGLAIKNMQVFDVESHINGANDFWVTIAYTATASSKKIKLSYEHDQFRWATPKELLRLKSSKKLKRFVKNLKNAKV